MRTVFSLILVFALFTGYTSCKTDNSLYKANRLNEEALRLLNEGKKEEAIVLFHQAISYTSVPDSSRRTFFSNLALVHDALDNTDSAKFFFRKAIELSPKGSFVYYTNYGQLYLMDSLVDKALNALEKAHHLNSDYAPINNLLGLIYLGNYDNYLYDPEKALPYNRKAYEAIRDVNSTTILAQNYYHVEMVEKSVALYKELHRDYPDNSSYLATIIMLEQELGNQEEVTFFLEKIKPLDPEAYQDLIDNPVEAGTHTLEW